jgi:hypothetical protein
VVFKLMAFTGFHEVATSSRDIAGTVQVALPNDGKTLQLDEWSIYAEWHDDPIGGPIIEDFMRATAEQNGSALDDRTCSCSCKACSSTASR